MPRDYKSNPYRTSKPQKKLGLDGWDRLLIVIFITLLALVIKHFIVSEKTKSISPVAEMLTPDSKTAEKVETAKTRVVAVAKEVVAATGLSDEEPNPEQKLTAQQVKTAADAKLKADAKANVPPRQDFIPVEPHFDFYTILPSVEVVIPDHEIKTRIREEKIGQGDKNAKYIMQAGSFRDALEAEWLKAKLTGMGIESRIEKAQVGEVMWYRVKIGPYSGMTSVMAVKNQLRDNGIDAIVFEFK